MSKKAWIIFAAVCVAVLGALVYFSNNNRVDVSSVDANAIQSANSQSGNIGDHVFGKTGSKVTLIEYGDYQCPGCGNAYPKVKAISEKYQGQLAFVFRNFPITSLHPNARAAAAAAEAAGLQGKFWQMHNMLYEGQSSWENLNASERTDFFVDYAKQLGLNTDTFKTDLSNEKINQKISYDQALAKKVNVTGTPTFYLNGQEIDQDTWADQTKFDQRIATELKNNNIPLP